MVKLLLEAGAKKNAVMQNGRTALHVAILNGHREVAARNRCQKWYRHVPSVTCRLTERCWVAPKRTFHTKLCQNIVSSVDTFGEVQATLAKKDSS